MNVVLDEVVNNAVSEPPDLVFPMLFLIFLFLIVMYVVGKK